MIRYQDQLDQAFIHSTWITNLYQAKPYSFIPWDIFRKNQDQLVEDLQSISKTLVYCSSENPNIILGYLCYSHLQDNLIIHFGFVKEKLRNNHIMSELLQTADSQYKKKLIIITHTTKMYASLSKKFDIIYDPYIISTLKELHKELI